MFLSLLFHELGVIIPLLIIAYSFKDRSWILLKENLKKLDYLLLFIPVLTYLLMRFFAQSHWLSGDYNYNLWKLPFNFVGNTLGYVSLVIIGQTSLPIYETIRGFLRENTLVALTLTVLGIIVLVFVAKKVFNIFDKKEKDVISFGFLFFVISLLPFLGLGNITSRYSYLAALGLILILVVLIKKLYLYLLVNGKEIALASISILIIVFSLFHIIQLQQSYFDWRGAGQKVQNFFISVDELYSGYWSNTPIELHFVNVPIKYGDAWVFPVGLKDAIWFAFKNDKAKVYIHNDLQSALQQTKVSRANKILKFNDDGSVQEIINTLKKSPANTYPN